MSKVDNNQDNTKNIGGLIAEATAIASKIQSATSPQEAKALIASLMALLQLANGSPLLLSFIQTIIVSVEGKVSSLEVAESERRIAEMRSHWSADTNQLYDDLNNKSLLSPEDKQFIASIDPDKKYEIATFDDEGKLQKNKIGREQTAAVKGEEVQKSFMIIKKHANKEQFSAAEQEHMNSAKGQRELKKAVKTVQGHAYAQAKTTEEKVSITKATSDVFAEFRTTTPSAPNPALKKKLNTITNETAKRAIREVALPENTHAFTDAQAPKTTLNPAMLNNFGQEASATTQVRLLDVTKHVEKNIDLAVNPATQIKSGLHSPQSLPSSNPNLTLLRQQTDEALLALLPSSTMSNSNGILAKVNAQKPAPIQTVSNLPELPSVTLAMDLPLPTINNSSKPVDDLGSKTSQTLAQATAQGKALLSIASIASHPEPKANDDLLKGFLATESKGPLAPPVALAATPPPSMPTPENALEALDAMLQTGAIMPLLPNTTPSMLAMTTPVLSPKDIPPQTNKTLLSSNLSIPKALNPIGKSV